MHAEWVFDGGKVVASTGRVANPPLLELVGMKDVLTGDTVRLPDAGTEFKVVHVRDDGTAMLEQAEKRCAS